MSALLSKLNLAAGITVLVLTILLITSASSNQTLQTEAQAQEAKLRKSQQTQQASAQVAANIAKELAPYSVQNEKARALLQRHGFNVQVRPPAAAARPAGQ